MKKKMILPLLAAFMACGILACSGCGEVDLADVTEEDMTLSAELETENLSDGSIVMHSVWYDASGEKLSAAHVSLSDGNDTLFDGTTDDSGNLEECALPCNTAISCVVTDSDRTLAESEIVFKLSFDYTELTIETPHDPEENQCVLEIPADTADIRAAVFLAEDRQLSFANLSPYTESDEDTAAGAFSGEEDENEEEGISGDEASDDSRDTEDDDGQPEQNTEDDGTRTEQGGEGDEAQTDQNADAGGAQQ